jgi:hypothetical protein
LLQLETSNLDKLHPLHSHPRRTPMSDTLMTKRPPRWVVITSGIIVALVLLVVIAARLFYPTPNSAYGCPEGSTLVAHSYLPPYNFVCARYTPVSPAME